MVAPAVVWRNNADRAHTEAALNYKLVYAQPNGWVEKKHSPQTLFVYENADGVTMKGGHMQIVDSENPTPDMDRDTLSDSFASVTRDNLGWKATMGDIVECDGGSYRLIRREGKDRTIISAVSVKGNTTILVTLSAIGKSKPHVDEDLPAFVSFLKSSKLALIHYE